MKAKKKIVSVFIPLFFSIAHTTIPIGKNCAITYISPSGRLGDWFDCFFRAQYLAYKYKLPFFYNKFRYFAKEFSAYHEIPHVTSDVKKRYAHNPRIRHEDMITKSNKNDTLFTVSWQAKLDEDIHLATAQNPDLAAEFKHALRPAIDIDFFDLPEDAISVAIHVRRGGGYDKRLKKVQYESSELPCFTHPRFPAKIVPDQFYIDQMILLADLFPDTTFYVFIFTDDQHPEEVAELFETTINRPNVIIDSRKGEHHHTKNVIEDFFIMTTFDILIRPDSGFSWGAQLLGDHKATIAPTKARIKNDRLEMDPPQALLADRINHVAEYLVFTRETKQLKEKLKAYLET